MKQKSNDASEHDELGKDAEEYNQVDDQIKASDSSRNEERGKRISEEQGTKRLRTKDKI